MRKELENSLIGKMNYTDKVLALYNSTVAGLAEIVSDIATVCPLYFLHQKIPGAKFYLLKQVNKYLILILLVYIGLNSMHKK